MMRILLTPTKNEAHILSAFIDHHRKYFDHIIIADQFSDDDTWEIANSYDCVSAIRNTGGFDEINRRQILIDEAKRLDACPLIFGLDADEFLVVEHYAWSKFCTDAEADPVERCYSFPWVHVLPTLDGCHRVKAIFCRIGFSGSLGSSEIHAPRVSITSDVEHCNQISVLHLNMMWPKRQRMKVWWYATIEARLSRFINIDTRRQLLRYGNSQLYAYEPITESERICYSKILDSIDLDDSWDTWHKAEILKCFLEPQLLAKLRHAPIWDYPWDYERSNVSEVSRLRQSLRSYLLDEWVFRTRLNFRSPFVRLVDALLRRVPRLY